MEESAYISNQNAEIIAARRFSRSFEQVSSHIAALPDDMFPPIHLQNIIGSSSLDHFRQVGLDFFLEISRRLRIRPDSTVLDLGCGCGRMAIPFVEYLNDGQYIGCDAWADGIQWCREHLTGYGNARFEVCETNNNYYFEALDRERPNQLALPWVNDGSLDAVFAISVFTHLTIPDAVSYLRELKRTLKPNGLVFATFFMIDRYVWRHIDATGEHRALKEAEHGTYYAYQGQDFFAGHSEQKIREMVQEAGLRLVSIDLGSWANKPGSRCYQDTLIIERP